MPGATFVLQSDSPDIHKGVGDETVRRTVPAGASRPASFACYRRGSDSISPSDYPRYVMRFHGVRYVVKSPTGVSVLQTDLGGVALAPAAAARRPPTCRYPYVYVARLEDDPSFRARVRVVGAGEGRASRLGVPGHKAVRNRRRGPAAPGSGVDSKKL